MLKGGDDMAKAAADRDERLALPPAGTTYWVSRRKAQVVMAVERGLLSIDEVCRRYRMDPEEFALWRRRLHKAGKQSLRITRTQEYRRKETPQS
jgi:hypothetical protein